MTPAHATIARYARALRLPAPQLAEALGVAPATVYGWLQAADGAELTPGRPGRKAPDAEHLARAKALLEAHGVEVADALG